MAANKKNYNLKIEISEPMLLDVFLGNNCLISKVCLPGEQVTVVDMDDRARVVIKPVDITMKF